MTTIEPFDNRQLLIDVALGNLQIARRTLRYVIRNDVLNHELKYVKNDVVKIVDKLGEIIKIIEKKHT